MGTTPSQLCSASLAMMATGCSSHCGTPPNPNRPLRSSRSSALGTRSDLDTDLSRRSWPTRPTARRGTRPKAVDGLRLPTLYSVLACFVERACAASTHNSERFECARICHQANASYAIHLTGLLVCAACVQFPSLLVLWRTHCASIQHP